MGLTTTRLYIWDAVRGRLSAGAGTQLWVAWAAMIAAVGSLELFRPPRDVVSGDCVYSEPSALFSRGTVLQNRV
jgi:hypothetical protein